MREELKAVGWRTLGYFIVLEGLLAAAILVPTMIAARLLARRV